MRFGVHLLFALILAMWSVRVLGPVNSWESRIAAEDAAAGAGAHAGKRAWAPPRKPVL